MASIDDMLPAGIFKAYDIRGVVGKTLTEEGVRLIGRAVGTEARARQQTTVAVGRDGRLSGPALAGALSEGLMSAGCDVIDIGQAPTPVVYFATHFLETRSGIAVTGSHNPPEYNGLKIVVGGEALYGDGIQSLRARIAHGELDSGSGRLTGKPVNDAYIQRIAGDVQLARPMKIAVDCGNGVAGAVAPALYRELGCEVIELYCEVDGNFPNHHPDPSQPGNLAEMIDTVKREGCDLGLAFDGDGDRLGVVSPDGDIIWPDRNMILFARDVLSRQPGATIIYDVKCSRTLPAAIEEAGGEPMMWTTGHSLIKARLRESGAALAGEMSGHFFFQERWYGFDDGLYSGARLLELLARDSRSTGEIFGALPNTVNTPELRIEMSEGENHAFIEELKRHARFDDATVSTIDGVRVDFPDGFGLVRASNTTPVVVLRFEGDDDDALKRIQDRFRDLIETTRPGLDIPF